MPQQTGKKKITSEKVVVTSFLVDISDVLVSIIVAVMSGSVVMLSQAFEGSADLLASGFLLIGIRQSKKPSDRKHPYGHGREIYFWTFLSALTTFTITAGASFYFGYKRFLNPEPIHELPLAFLALIISVFTNGYSMMLSVKRLRGQKPMEEIWHTFKNSALIETKTTLVLDLMGTTASVLGLLALLLFSLSGNLKFDGLGAMAIGVTLAILAAFIVKGAKDLLVGQAASPEIEAKIIKAATSDPNVRKVLDLRTLHIGSEKLLVNMEIHLADELTTDEIETLIDKIESAVKRDVPSATHIQIELETPDVDK